MKQIYLVLLLAMAIGVNAQTPTLSYQQSAGATASQYLTSGLETTVNYLSTCQESVSATFVSQNFGNGAWSDGNFEYYVNGSLVGSGIGQQTVDLTAYIPITSIRLKKTNQANWNAIDVVVQVALPDAFPTAPQVSDLTYCQNAPAAPLNAILTGTGVGLKWYTSATGSGYSVTAPTPTTNELGLVSYWVSQEDESGCESERSLIEVSTVVADTNLSQTNDEITVAQADAIYQWGTCDSEGNFTPIEGAVSQSYVAEAIGSYAVEVTLNSCTSRSLCHEVTSLNTEAYDFGDVRVYPNPTSQILTVNLRDAAQVQMTISDMNGRQLLTQTYSDNSVDMDLSNLNSGIYLLHITKSGATTVKKIVKQ